MGISISLLPSITVLLLPFRKGIEFHEVSRGEIGTYGDQSSHDWQGSQQRQSPLLPRAQ